MVERQTAQMHDVSLDHNTAFPATAMLNVGARASGPKIADIVFTNNLFPSGQRGIVSTGGGRNNCSFQPERQGPEGVLARCFESYKFNYNCIIGAGGFSKGKFWLK